MRRYTQKREHSLLSLPSETLISMYITAPHSPYRTINVTKGMMPKKMAFLFIPAAKKYWSLAFCGQH